MVVGNGITIVILKEQLILFLARQLHYLKDARYLGKWVAILLHLLLRIQLPWGMYLMIVDLLEMHQNVLFF